MEALRIVYPGVLTSIQDQGRYGFMKYGVPPSGAMDQYSYQVGNLLLGNGENEASLEITSHGLVVEAVASITVAITGGDLSPHLNNTPAPQWEPCTVKKGDHLHFKWRRQGFRAYLAIKGGLNIPKILSSRSTFIRGRIGMVLKRGDILKIGKIGVQNFVDPEPLPREYLPQLSDRNSIRVLIGPQDDYYTLKGIETFFTSLYKITSQSDRMAYRTEGPPIEVAKGPGIITEPIPRGAIQVPGDGKPILLLRDAQVTGGYAKIGTVISADMDRLGQMMPGDLIRFQQTDSNTAIELLTEEKRKIDSLRALLNRPRKCRKE